MNDLDTQALRQALKAPAGPGGPVDVTRIMARGRRLRQRRRLAAVAGCLCAAAVLAGTATAIANLTAAPPAQFQPAGPGGHRQSGQQPSAVASQGPSPAQRTAVPVRGTPTPVPTKAIPASSPTPRSTVSALPTASGLPTVSVLPVSTSQPTPLASPTPSPTATPTAP